MATPKTHLDIVQGQLTQIETGTSYPTTREDPAYIVGNGAGLDDGDLFYDSANESLGIHMGGTWVYIEFNH